MRLKFLDHINAEKTTISKYYYNNYTDGGSSYDFTHSVSTLSYTGAADDKGF